jgi:hypothetical protein
MPEALQALQRHLLRHAGGDPVMAQVLAAVPVHGLEAVLVPAELALEAGRPSAEHVLNVLARLKALKLHGMAANWPELVAAHCRHAALEPEALLTHLLDAEGAERTVRSIAYQMTAARMSCRVDARELGARSFIGLLQCRGTRGPMDRSFHGSRDECGHAAPSGWRSRSAGICRWSLRPREGRPAFVRGVLGTCASRCRPRARPSHR